MMARSREVLTGRLRKPIQRRYLAVNKWLGLVLSLLGHVADQSNEP